MKNQSFLYKRFILVCFHLTSMFYNLNKTVFFIAWETKIIHTLIFGGDIQVMSKFAARNTKGCSKWH